MKKLLAKAVGLGAAVAPLAALAQSYSYEYSSSSDMSDAAAAGLGIGMLIFIGVCVLIGLAFLILWVMMLIDCFKRQFEQRNTWLIVLIVGMLLGFHWIAAILYYFMVKRKDLGGGAKPAAPAAPQEPAA